MSHHKPTTAVGQDGSASAAAGSCPRPYGVLPLESKISGRSSKAGVVPNKAVGGAAGGAFAASGGGGDQASREVGRSRVAEPQISFERLNTLVKAGKTANAPSQDVTRGARAAAVLDLKKDPLGFKLRSHFLKKLEDPTFLHFYYFDAASRNEAKAEEAALLAVDLPEHLLSARQKRDNAHTMKMAVLFKLRDEFKSMTAAWKTALSTVADEIAQADALPEATNESVWARVENYLKLNRGAKALPSALAMDLDLVTPAAPAEKLSANSNPGMPSAKKDDASSAGAKSDACPNTTDAKKVAKEGGKAGPTAAGDKMKERKAEPTNGEKVRATGGAGVNGKEKLVKQATATASATATSALPSPNQPACAPLTPLPVVVGPERKPGDPPSCMGGLTVVSLAPVYNVQQAPHGFLAFWPQE